MKSVLGVVRNNAEQRTNSGRSLTGAYDFVLEFAAGVEPERREARGSISSESEKSGSDRGSAVNKHRLAAKVLDRLQQNGLEYRKVQSSKKGAEAYALRGKFETLLKRAEKLKMRKPLIDGQENGKTALFTLARAGDFINAEDPSAFFSSGERLILLEGLVTADPLIRSAQGLHTFANDFDGQDEDQRDEQDGEESGNNQDDSDANSTKSGTASSGKSAKPSPSKRKRRGSALAHLVFGNHKNKPIRVVQHLVPLHNPDEVEDLMNTWIKSLRPQPLDKIMHYFGHARGFYFAFLGSYTFWLVPAAILGVIVFQVQSISGGFDNTSTLLYLGFLSLWSTGFTEYWKRREATLAFRWDSLDYEALDEATRPAFKEKAKRVYHPAADAYRWVYPTYKHSLALVLSFIACSTLSLLACTIMTGFLYLDHEAKASVGHWGGVYQLAQYVPLGCYMAVIQVFSAINNVLAEWLTNLEMHRTETAHENARIVKLATLQFFNYHVSPLYVAFFEHDMVKLYSTVAGLLGLHQVLGQVLEVGKPLAMTVASAVGIIRTENKPTQGSENQEDSQLPVIGRSDLVLAPQETLFPEYLEMWIQFGQVTLFSAVFPLAALLALLNNLVEMKSDAMKMLRFQRRSIGSRVSGIGTWVFVFEAVGYLGVMTNVALVGLIFSRSSYGSHLLKGWMPWQKVILLVFVEHVVIGLKALVSVAIPDLDSETAFVVRARRVATEQEIASNFELRAHCQELLRKDRKEFTFRDSSDQGRQLLRNTLHPHHSSSAASSSSTSSTPTEQEGPQRRASRPSSSGLNESADDASAGLDESMLFQWIMDQEDRRRRAEKLKRYYRKKLDRSNETRASAHFSEFPQALNIVVSLGAILLLITREARESLFGAAGAASSS
ncbi:Anoctamin-10 [Hondaea fermentalgiana]|uniref:Anoctamin-10 n=1 Tax=Hondaea fermentalgiana TaxID=2315210 RepID=A0A2R5GND3_9STRA|nr:Anoctamin-10 [Hondaea fermentalgiana]|eukprot:GBG32390.1 Anoctamin-10 [Hondaea fermentalgiana]